MVNAKIIAALTLSFAFFVGCNKKDEPKKMETLSEQTAGLYSYNGSEYEVSFTAVAKTKSFTLDEVATETYYKDEMLRIAQMNVKYLFGPLTNRYLGGMKLNSVITMDWNQAVQQDDQLVVPFVYKGTWILSETSLNKKSYAQLPLPFDSQSLITPNWLECTDSDPEHQTESFFWYFWDPKRSGCDHQLNVDYQMIQINLGKQTVNQTETYPEYQNMINSNGVTNNLQATFAFGYVEDVENANPDNDSDSGMYEYRKFTKFMDKEAKALKLTKTAILQKEYLNPASPDSLIGYRYTGSKNGVKVDIKVVASAGIDQMELFAKSYAHDHDAFFGWFGHSRVGSGFDAQNFSYIVHNNPDFYSLTTNYQLAYWAGCNSYSYYTLPFFKQKSELNKAMDPNGTKSLDLINNVLPSLFSFNANNAMIAYNALINWDKPTSYQKIVSQLEQNAQKSGTTVIVNVLGDEDNTFVKP